MVAVIVVVVISSSSKVVVAACIGRYIVGVSTARGVR